MVRKESMLKTLFPLAVLASMPTLLAAPARMSSTTGAEHGTHLVATWTEKAPMPIARAEVGVAEVGGKVYVIGGQALAVGGPPQWATTLNQMYDPATNSWHECAPLPEKLSHVGVAALGGKIYAIGGFTDIVHMGPRPAAFAYDPVTDRWTRLPDISSPRGSVAVAAVDGKLHIFGGRQQDRVEKIPTAPHMPELRQAFGTVNFHQVFDPATGKWSSAAPVPGPPRDHMGIAVLDGKIHIFGGRVADVVDNLDRHDVYDPRTGRWSTAAPLPRPRSAGAYTVLRGRIIYAGGECKPGARPDSANAFRDVTAYDPKTDSWSTLTPLPQARQAFGAATVGGVAYFAGGAPTCGGGFTTDTLALSLHGR